LRRPDAAQPAVSETSAGTANGSAVVANPHGIHARPSHAIVVAAQGFAAQIFLEFEGRRADARSILSVMTLGAPCGARITVRADGPDAAGAVEAILALLRSTESN
jgi:phosphocarrier protein